jgi:long-subunit acyl-CoA synthetase (AMP-forming)
MLREESPRAHALSGADAASFGVAQKPFLCVFYARERAHPNRVFLRQTEGGRMRDLTWGETGRLARTMAQALLSLGVLPGDRVGIYSKNCVHWIVADLAILMCGAVSVPYYPTVGADQLAELLALSDLRALFVGKVDAWDDRKHVVPQTLPTIAFPHYAGNAVVDAQYTWDGLLRGRAPLRAPHTPALSEPFTVIFTSGTTGSPKGAVLNYEGPRALAEHELEAPAYHAFEGGAAKLFSFLPLNHVAERFATEINGIFAGSTIAFAESIQTFAADLRRVQPTFFFAVPRIWTKMQHGLELKLGAERLRALLSVPLLGSVAARVLRLALGLGRVQVALSGAAPLPASTLDFFGRLGIAIQEVYGMTEAGGAVTLNPRGKARSGSVGCAISGVSVTIDPATSEVLVRTPWMMDGYFRAPERTAELMGTGFIRTGDRGQLDAARYLTITGRVSEAFKTASGKFVVPSKVEALLLACPHVEQVMVTGRGLAHPVALVCLSQDSSSADRRVVAVELSRALEAASAQLEPHERVRKAVVLRQRFAVEDGTLTPTLKLRRHVIEARYVAQLEPWLTHAESVLFE